MSRRCQQPFIWQLWSTWWDSEGQLFIAVSSSIFLVTFSSMSTRMCCLEPSMNEWTKERGASTYTLTTACPKILRLQKCSQFDFVKRDEQVKCPDIHSSQATIYIIYCTPKLSKLECGKNITHRFWLWLSGCNMLYEMRCNVLFPQMKIFSYWCKLPSFKCLILMQCLLLWKTHVSLHRPGRWRAHSHTTNSRRHDYKGNHISYNKIGCNLQK